MHITKPELVKLFSLLFLVRKFRKIVQLLYSYCTVIVQLLYSYSNRDLEQ